jgi:hypothetical protein
MIQQFIQTAVQRANLSNLHIVVQKVSHRAMNIPMPMQPPFTARFYQSIADQRFKYMQPVCPFSTRPEFVSPKFIQI